MWQLTQQLVSWTTPIGLVVSYWVQHWVYVAPPSEMWWGALAWWG